MGIPNYLPKMQCFLRIQIYMWAVRSTLRFAQLQFLIWLCRVGPKRIYLDFWTFWCLFIMFFKKRSALIVIEVISIFCYYEFLITRHLKNHMAGTMTRLLFLSWEATCLSICELLFASCLFFVRFLISLFVCGLVVRKFLLTQNGTHLGVCFRKQILINLMVD